MTYERQGPESLDYFPCRYGTSKLLFRGPKRRLRDPYVAYIGGIETYGKFIELPFPTLIEHETGLKSVNLGCAHAGVDAYLSDRSLVEICAGASATVVQIMGAQNMSNRFYAVHPRRNDRFLRASSQLRSLYGDVDFTEFSFTRHLLSTLSHVEAESFLAVEQELKTAWVARMTTLLDQIGENVLLLWLADHAPEDGATASEPMFIDREMLSRLHDSRSKLIEVVATPNERKAGLQEMVFGTLEEPAAQEVLGPVVHRRVAEALSPALRELVG